MSSRVDGIAVDVAACYDDVGRDAMRAAATSSMLDGFNRQAQPHRIRSPNRLAASG
jgi:hypothetical protein